MVSMSSDKFPEDVAECRRRAQELIQGLTPDQLTRRSDPAKWSIAECLAHLNMTAALVQPFIASGIERGKKAKRVGAGPFRFGVRGRLLVWMAEPPAKFCIPAPKALVPVSIPEPAKLLPDFMKVQDEWQRLWNAAEGLDMAAVNIGPLLSPFRCRLSASFPWMMAHQRRHLLQAEKVKGQIGAKAASA